MLDKGTLSIYSAIPSKKVVVIAWFGTKNIAQINPAQLLDVWPSAGYWPGHLQRQ
jgi:hypothetical protein